MENFRAVFIYLKSIHTYIWMKLQSYREISINDYRANIFNIAFLDDETVQMFQSDFRYVAEFFVLDRKDIEYVPDTKSLEHVDEVLKLLRVLTGKPEYDIEFSQEEKERGVNMREIMNKVEKKSVANAREEGREQGRKEGREEGRAIGKEEGKAIDFLQCVNNVMKNAQMSLDGALHILGGTMQDYTDAQNLLEQQQ